MVDCLRKDSLVILQLGLILWFHTLILGL